MRIRPVVCVAAIAAALAIASCSTFPKARYESDPELQAALAQAPAYPDVRFLVLTDLHYMDPGLWGDGPAIEAYLKSAHRFRSSMAIWDTPPL